MIKINLIIVKMNHKKFNSIFEENL